MNDTAQPLAGRRALVTGGSRGIGAAIAVALAAAGADVAVSARHQADLETIAAAIRAKGRETYAAVCDVTDPDQVVAMAARVRSHLGEVDILVNNAGAAGSHKFIDHPDELWHKMLAVNLTGVYYVSKAFVPGMVERGWGRVITIASVAGKSGGRYITAYSAAKHGVLGLTKSLALEVAPAVTVNAICPGYVDTPMTDQTIANIVQRTEMSVDQARAALTRDVPQKRLITPEEVAALTVMLAGKAAAGITGQAINVDGGAVM